MKSSIAKMIAGLGGAGALVYFLLGLVPDVAPVVYDVIAPERRCTDQYVSNRVTPERKSFRILVTGLRGDRDDRHFGLMLRSLERLYVTPDSPIVIEEVATTEGACLLRTAGGDLAQSLSDARNAAIALLTATDGDVVIWGSVASDETALTLRFTQRGDQRDDDYRFERDADSRALVIEPRFSTELGALIGAKAVSSVVGSPDRAGTNLVPAMRRVEAILAPLVETPPQGLRPLDLGNLHVALGQARYWIGWQHGDPARLESAISHYRAAEPYYRSLDDPERWMRLLNNLGEAQRSLGEMEAGTARLSEAVDTHRRHVSARESRARDHSWAMAQSGLGTALWSLGVRQQDKALLEQAKTALTSALGLLNEQDHVLDWTTTQTNLGNVYQSIGAIELVQEPYDQALVHYDAALRHTNPVSEPLKWSSIQNNRVSALMVVSVNTGRLDMLDEGLQTMAHVRKLFSREQHPGLWATAQLNTGRIFAMRGIFGDDVRDRERGLTAMRQAEEVFRDIGAAAQVAQARAEIDKFERINGSGQ